MGLKLLRHCVVNNDATELVAEVAAMRMTSSSPVILARLVPRCVHVKNEAIDRAALQARIVRVPCVLDGQVCRDVFRFITSK